MLFEFWEFLPKGRFFITSAIPKIFQPTAFFYCATYIIWFLQILFWNAGFRHRHNIQNAVRQKKFFPPKISYESKLCIKMIDHDFLQRNRSWSSTSMEWPYSQQEQTLLLASPFSPRQSLGLKSELEQRMPSKVVNWIKLTKLKFLFLCFVRTSTKKKKKKLLDTFYLHTHSPYLAVPCRKKAEQAWPLLLYYYSQLVMKQTISYIFSIFLHY